jgi:hypothetical protein
VVSGFFGLKKMNSNPKDGFGPENLLKAFAKHVNIQNLPKE